MIDGMSRGVFTGVGLPRYINDNNNDYWNARRTVNGTDQASLIEQYTKMYYLTDPRIVNYNVSSIFNRQPYNIKPRSINSLDFDVVGSSPNSGTQVKLWQSSNGINQKWGYNKATREIVGLNDKCLDGGDVNNTNNRWIRIDTCHGGNNQKWEADTDGRIHSVANYSLCIDSASGNVAGSVLYLYNCHTGYNQQWDVWGLGMDTSYRTPWTTIKSAYNSSFVFDAWGGGIPYSQQPIRMGNANAKPNGATNQIFQYSQRTYEIRNYGGKCVDGGAVWLGAGQNTTWLRMENCHGGNNQKWVADNLGRIHSVYDYNLCIDSALGNVNGSNIYLSGCHNGSNQRWNWW
jgi:Ricin-type beta-trefoil lectin domain